MGASSDSVGTATPGDTGVPMTRSAAASGGSAGSAETHGFPPVTAGVGGSTGDASSSGTAAPAFHGATHAGGLRLIDPPGRRNLCKRKSCIHQLVKFLYVRFIYSIFH